MTWGDAIAATSALTVFSAFFVSGFRTQRRMLDASDQQARAIANWWALTWGPSLAVGLTIAAAARELAASSSAMPLEARMLDLAGFAAIATVPSTLAMLMIGHQMRREARRKARRGGE
jgi:hypothetical protein